MQTLANLSEDNSRLHEFELERRVSERAELAKRALQDYRETTREQSARLSARRLTLKRRVERAVTLYMSALKELDTLRARASDSE